jgi:hypothetical protein
VCGSDGGTALFPTRRNDVTSAAESSRSLQAWLWATLLAPLMPWFFFPLPIGALMVGILIALPFLLTSGYATPESLLIYGVFSIVGVLWMITGLLAFLSARRRKWQKALWFALTNLGCGVTTLGTFLTLIGPGPVEPFGYVSPLAFLTLAALPAAYEIARRWLRELGNRSGPDAARTARSRLLILGVGYAVVLAVSFGGVGLAVALTIQQLPAPHFYAEAQTIRGSGASTFAILGTFSLAVFLALSRFFVRFPAGRPRTA